MDKSNGGGRRWSHKQEIEFWEELKAAWEKCREENALTIELGDEATDYFMILCNDAFRKKWAKTASRFPAPTAKEIWRDLLGHFVKKDKTFFDDVIEGGIDYAIKKGWAQNREISECMKAIKGRLYRVIKTSFFRQWLKPLLRQELEESLDVPKEKGGLTEGEKIESPKIEDDFETRELQELGAATAKTIFIEEMIHDCSRWALRELLPGRAERVVYLFGKRKLMSARSEELKADLGAKRASTFYDVYNGQVKNIVEKVERLDSGLLDMEAKVIVGCAVMNNLEKICQEWFYSEKLNEGLFSCLPTRDNWK